MYRSVLVLLGLMFAHSQGIACPAPFKNTFLADSEMWIKRASTIFVGRAHSISGVRTRTEQETQIPRQVQLQEQVIQFHVDQPIKGSEAPVQSVINDLTWSCRSVVEAGKQYLFVSVRDYRGYPVAAGSVMPIEEAAELIDAMSQRQ